MTAAIAPEFRSSTRPAVAFLATGPSPAVFEYADLIRRQLLPSPATRRGRTAALGALSAAPFRVVAAAAPPYFPSSGGKTADGLAATPPMDSATGIPPLRPGIQRENGQGERRSLRDRRAQGRRRIHLRRTRRLLGDAHSRPEGPARPRSDFRTASQRSPATSTAKDRSSASTAVRVPGPVATSVFPECWAMRNPTAGSSPPGESTISGTTTATTTVWTPGSATPPCVTHRAPPAARSRTASANGVRTTVGMGRGVRAVVAEHRCYR